MTEVMAKQSRFDLWAFSRLGKTGHSVQSLFDENIKGQAARRWSRVQSNGRYMMKFPGVATSCPRRRNRSKLGNTAVLPLTKMTGVKTWNERDVMDLPVRQISAAPPNSRASIEPVQRKILVDADELFGMYQYRTLVRYRLTWLEQG